VSPSQHRTEAYEDGEGGDRPSARVLAVLHSHDPRLRERRIPLGDRLTFGRQEGEDVDLALDDARVSRRHATIRRTSQDGYEIEDHGSTNGTFVDGARVRACALDEGAIVRVGETVFELVVDVEVATAIEDPEIIGCSPALAATLAVVDRVAATAAAVLVVGETGVGKELIARRIHRLSGRTGPLVPVNCGAIPANLMESALFGHKKGAFTDATTDSAGTFAAAHGGSLFLDEIGVMPLELQPKLLRVLETREFTPLGTTTLRRVDVRLIAATNVDLRAEGEAGRFRRDLYARLAEYTVEVPPLRRRRADILLLARHFLGALAPKRTLTWTAAFAEALVLQPWTMNVRELRAAMQHVVLEDPEAQVLKTALLPRWTQSRPAVESAPAPPAARPPTREELEAALTRCGGNVAQVAQLFGRSRMQLYRWLEKFDLVAEKYRGS